jgi:hypothetical protein
LIRCGLLAKRDIIPVRVGLRFVVVVVIDDESFANKTLVQDSVVDSVVFSLSLGLEPDDFGGLR